MPQISQNHSTNYENLRESTNYGGLREFTNYGGHRRVINYGGHGRFSNYGDLGSRIRQIFELSGAIIFINNIFAIVLYIIYNILDGERD